MSIVVVGNVDPVKISKVIENGVKKNEPFEEKIKKVYPTEPDEVAKQYAEQSLSVAMPLFMTGFKDSNNGFGGDELLKKSIETNIILKMLFGRSSKFYKSLYEKGLINNRFSPQTTFLILSKSSFERPFFLVSSTSFITASYTALGSKRGKRTA